MVARATSALGPVTIPGQQTPGSRTWRRSRSSTASAFDRLRRVNVDGVIHATRAVMAGMRARKYGRIVNIVSDRGAGHAMPGTSLYAATKAEAAILTKRFALELGPDGITVKRRGARLRAHRHDPPHA